MRAEIVTNGIDEAVQLVGGDPYGSVAQMGLRIPSLVPAGTGGNGRYLFLLGMFSLSDGEKACIRGMRQYLSLGFEQLRGEDAPPTHRVVEQQIYDPHWHFQDGNVTWHLQDLGTPDNTSGVVVPTVNNPSNRDSFAFRMSGGPALLYETATIASPFYVKLTAYTPPNGGKPWGVPLIEGGMSVMRDLRFGWRETPAWNASLDIPIVGPKTVALFASVRQSNPETRPALVLPTPYYGSAFEETFLQNWPLATYWRIAASLVVDS